MVAERAQMSITELAYQNLMIQMNDPNDSATIDALSEDLAAASIGVKVISQHADLMANQRVNTIINSTFYSIIAITMFLCFFSLCASMSSNLYEQKKEIAILRAMGVTKLRIRLLYFYEALIMVVASCTLGVLIGVVVAYMMIAQQNLALEQKLSFYFPWEQFLFIVAISILCAFLSTWGPVSDLIRRPIASIFRMT